MRDLTTSSEAPYLRLRATCRTRPACPEGPTAGPIHATASTNREPPTKRPVPGPRTEPKPVAPLLPDSRLRQPGAKKKCFVEKHVLLNWLKPATSILFRCSRLGSDHPRRLTDEASLSAMLASISICHLPRSVKNLESTQNRRQATTLKRSSHDSVCR